jgi:hypothetical protein
MGAVLSECLQRSHFPVAVDAEGAPFAGVPTAREGSALRESHSHLSEVGGGPPRDAVGQTCDGFDCVFVETRLRGNGERWALSRNRLDPLAVVGWPGASQPPSHGSRRDSLPSPGSSHRPSEHADPSPVGERAGLSFDHAGPPSLEPLVGPQPSVLSPCPATQVDADAPQERWQLVDQVTSPKLLLRCSARDAPRVRRCLLAATRAKVGEH